MLLLTPEAPGVVFEHSVSVAVLQSVVEYLGLPQPLQLYILLLLVETGIIKSKSQVSFRHKDRIKKKVSTGVQCMNIL